MRALQPKLVISVEIIVYQKYVVKLWHPKLFSFFLFFFSWDRFLHLLACTNRWQGKFALSFWAKSSHLSPCKSGWYHQFTFSSLSFYRFRICSHAQMDCTTYLLMSLADKNCLVFSSYTIQMVSQKLDVESSRYITQYRYYIFILT